jgi:hypothetical protein
MFRDIVDLTVSACIIRGLFTESWHKQKMAMAHTLVAEGHGTPYTLAKSFVAGIGLGALCALDGAEAFVEDGKKVFKYLNA